MLGCALLGAWAMTMPLNSALLCPNSKEIEAIRGSLDSHKSNGEFGGFLHPVHYVHVSWTLLSVKLPSIIRSVLF